MIYLDHSATTPADPRVVEAMLPYFTQIYGNPSSGHGIGAQANVGIERARETIAAVLNCKPTEIVFTSGGSEADNLAIRGAAWAARQQGKGNHIITTPIEHGAIGKTVKQLVELQAFDATVLKVDSVGAVRLEDFAAACRPTTTLASVMYANNEVGTIEPIAELAEYAHSRGIVFHTDAVQAAGQLPLDVQALNVDLLSVSAHKFYGPKGIGLLYVREGVDVTPAQTGGGQEHGLRAGTENVALIVGLAKALELAYAERDSRIAHYDLLRNRLIGGILDAIPNARLTGSPTNRLPSHASFVFEHIDSSELLDSLNVRGIAASAASACKTGSVEPSSVLLACGIDHELAKASLRLSLGLQNTVEDVDYAIDTLAEVVSQITRQAA
jgi:cysteine desulfurase